MNSEEMLAGLRDLLRRVYEDDNYPGSDELVIEAAITALEAGANQWQDVWSALAAYRKARHGQ